MKNFVLSYALRGRYSHVQIRNLYLQTLLYVCVICTLSETARSNESYPPLLKSTAEQQSYIVGMLEKYPWIKATQIPQYLPNYTSLFQQWLEQLYSLPEFQSLAAERPSPITIHIQEPKKSQVAELTFDESMIPKLRQDISLILERLPDREALSSELLERLQILSIYNPDKIMVGMINCIELNKSNRIFSIPSPREKLLALENESTLTDEVLSRKFNGQVHGFAPGTGKSELIQKIREVLAVKEEVKTLLRSFWYLFQKDDDHFSPDENSELLEAPLEEINPNFDLNDETRSEFLSSIFDLNSNWTATPDFQESLARSLKELDKEHTVKTTREVIQFETLYSLREVEPQLGIYRGVIGGDCATTNSYAFPFSPLERVFYLFNSKGELLPVYLSATVVTTAGVKTLYIHDIAGPGLDAKLQKLIIHSVEKSRKALGVDRISLATKKVLDANAGQDPNPGSTYRNLIDNLLRFSGEQVEHKYLDETVRNFLGSQPHSGIEYDSPKINQLGNLFVPEPGFDPAIAIEGVETENPASESKTKSKSKTDAFLNLAGLLAGNNNADMNFVDLGFSEGDAKRIHSALNNIDSVSLRDYYSRIQVVFEEFGITLSENFKKKNEHLFIYGHLSASDALTSRDPKQAETTIRFVMDELKRGKDRAHAFSLIQKSPKFFTDSRKFIDYISHIPLQRTEHLVRITGLLEVGIEPSLILNSTQRLRQAIHSGNPEVMLEAVRELSKNIGSDGTTSDVTLAGLAEALDNEKLTADIDQVSLLAVQSLLKVRTHNGNVNKSLLKSAKYEENLDIKYTAAAALFLNGIHIDEAASVLEEIQSSQGLSDATKNLVQTYLSAHDAPQCRDLFSLFGTRKENRP